MRRCQFGCARLFLGDVCPGCQTDHRIDVTVTAAERQGMPAPNAYHLTHGPARRVRRCGCGAEIPAGRGPRKYCLDCRPKALAQRSRTFLEKMDPEARRAMWRAAGTRRRGRTA